MVPYATLLLTLAVPLTVMAYGPCAQQPYVFGPQPCCRGGGGCSPWRGYQGGYQGVRYGQPQPYGHTYQVVVPGGGQYQVPHGGAYVTPPSVPVPVAPASVVHPTQSTPTDHSTSVAAAQTTTDELADIFDEFKGRDEEELLTGKLRSDTSANANLFLQPLQPPAGVRPAPYKPELGLSHDELLSTATKDELLSTSSITKDLVAETDSKTGFIPQSKPLPASFTQTAAGDKDPFAESAGMSSKSSPVSPTLSPASSSTRAQTMVAPASVGPYGSSGSSGTSGSSGSYGLGTASYGTAGSYAVAPRPVALPQPTSPYVRPYPFGPHNVPARPYVSPYGGYRPQPLPLAPCGASAPLPAPAGPYPAGPYPTQPQPIPGPTYTRIGGGAVPQAGYALPPHPVPIPAPRPLPPFVDCCGKCRSPCRNRVKRQFAAKLFDPEGKQVDIPPTKDGRCTSEELRTTMLKATTSTSTLSKRVIQKAAEEQFGGFFSVFCSKEDFSYTSRSDFYCQTSKNDVVCFAFRHN